MFDISRICLWSHLVLDFCLLEDFLIIVQFQYLWLVCSYFLFLPGSDLEGCIFLGICSFLISYDPLYFCNVVTFFISNFTDLSPLLFFLMSLAKGLSILFLKNQLLVLLIFAVVFFVLVAFISALIFPISFLLLT